MKIKIRPLQGDNLADFLAFFESIKFKEHPGWSVCYCYSFHFTGKAEEWTAENNRKAVQDLVRAGNMTGYLAYLGNKPVGWCNANNRLAFQRLSRIHDLDQPDHPFSCAIVCFLVNPAYRRKGIARELLHRVINDYTSQGYHWIEAYPEKEEFSEEKNYKGHLRLYLESGFEMVREYPDHLLVRRYLKPHRSPGPVR